ncbi:MAG: response regulator, partial [Myxococcales bacterium]|nr:response regulator [Myxococcales bacterium]
VAHDFNNLLVGMLGNASLARKALAPDSPAQDSLSRIEDAAMHASGLTNQMLAYSGKGRFLIESVDLSSLVLDMMRLIEVSISKRARVQFELDDRLPSVEGDASQLRQVVMNLLTNASDALEGRRGRLEVRVRARVRREGDHAVLLEVADDGCGLSEVARQRMFEPFFTTKPQGRGLGLAALQTIVDHHEGSIEVEDRPSGGTIFRIWFRRSESLSLDTPGFAPDRIELPPERAGTVLVVEDEELVRKVASRMVGRLGYDVLVASSGAEALSFLEEVSNIVCALVDVQMPGMTGLEVLGHVRDQHPGLPVVLMTGYAGPNAGQGPNTPDRWLRKPFSSAELQDALASTVSRTGPGPSPR